jgi:FkbM family methyltransferase
VRIPVIDRASSALSSRLRRRYARRAGRHARLGLLKLGTSYGGWIVPTALIRADWVVWDAGVGEDASFALELIGRFGCTVDAFDPTPRAIAFVRSSLAGEPRFRLHEVGLWSEDTKLRFWAPRDPSHVSHSVVNLQGTDEYFEAACRSVPSLLRELDQERVDLLKLDIEGAEHRVIASTLAAGVRPLVLCTEIDRPVGPLRFWRTIRGIVSAGYRLVAVDGWNFTFVRRDQLGGAPGESA